MFRSFILITLFISTHLFSSCSKNQDVTIDKETLVLVLADIMTIESYVFPDSIKTAKIDSVLHSNQITPLEFNNLKSTYQHDLVFWQSVYQDVEKVLKERRLDFLNTQKEAAENVYKADSLQLNRTLRTNQNR